MTANRKHIAHFVVCEQVSNFNTPKVSLHMTLDYDIKFVNKEISPFGGLSLFLKMLKRCRILKGRDAETLYADYIEGKRSYMDVTLEIRNRSMR